MRISPSAGYISLLFLLGGTLVAAHLVPSRTPEPLQKPLTSISPEIAGWTMSGTEELNPLQFSATSYIARTYTKDERSLGLLIGFHDSHQHGVSIHNPKNCLPGDGWEIWQSSLPVIIFEGRPVKINLYRIYRVGQRLAVLYWYQSRGRVTANEYTAKLLLMRDGLLEGRTSGSFVRIVLPDQPEAISGGMQFAERLMHQVQLCFRP
jgi:EpsI family protein